MKLVDMAKVCPYGQRNLERWIATYKQNGKDGLELRSTARKTQQNETPIRIKKHIIKLRKEIGECALKLF